MRTTVFSFKRTNEAGKVGLPESVRGKKMQKRREEGWARMQAGRGGQQAVTLQTGNKEEEKEQPCFLSHPEKQTGSAEQNGQQPCQCPNWWQVGGNLRCIIPSRG